VLGEITRGELLVAYGGSHLQNLVTVDVLTGQLLAQWKLEPMELCELFPSWVSCGLVSELAVF
jgi:hypothetical protein